MTTTTHSAYQLGITARLVRIRAERTKNRPGLRITGLPEEASRKIIERTAHLAERLGGQPRSTAVDCCDVDPGGSPLQKLPAACLHGLELPIILTVMGTDGGVDPARLAKTAAWAAVDADAGEPRESRCKGYRGAIPIARRIAREEMKLLVADENAIHSAAECGTFAVKTIGDAINTLNGAGGPPIQAPADSAPATRNANDYKDWMISPKDLRVLAMAAAGGHHVQIEGTEDDPRPNRYGRYVHRLLPDLTDDQGLETSLIHSAAGLLDPWTGRLVRAPLRAPHHTASTGAMTGTPRGPGEASLAHNGVLLLDEATEIARETLDSIKAALKLGSCTFYPTWAPAQIIYPSRSLLVTIVDYEKIGPAKRRLEGFLPPGVMHVKSGSRHGDRRMNGENAREKVAQVRALLARKPAASRSGKGPLDTEALRAIRMMNELWN